IKISGADERLQGVDQQGGLGAASAFFLAMAELQVVAELQLLRDGHEKPLAHHVRAQFGKLALVEPGETPEQLYAHHEAEHRVTQELKLLIVEDVAVGTARGLLVRMGSVREGALQQLPLPEAMAERFFQTRDAACQHEALRMRRQGRVRDRENQTKT